MFPVPWSSKWSWSLHLFFGCPMFLRIFGLYRSAYFGILFVSILCACCSHFFWYCFISFTMFCTPVFSLIRWFFSLSNFVIPSKCLKNFICAASKHCSSLFFCTQASLPNFNAGLAVMLWILNFVSLFPKCLRIAPFILLCHRANLISVLIGLVKPATLREAQKGLQCGMLEGQTRCYTMVYWIYTINQCVASSWTFSLHITTMHGQTRVKFISTVEIVFWWFILMFYLFHASQ